MSEKLRNSIIFMYIVFRLKSFMFSDLGLEIHKVLLFETVLLVIVIALYILISLLITSFNKLLNTIKLINT